MKCNECDGHLYGCPYEDDDIQECDEAKALTRMTELAYRVGREDAYKEIAYSDCVKKEEFEMLAYKKGREDAINEFISEMRKFYFNAELQSAKDDPCVIDAMIDLAVRTAKHIKGEEEWKEKN